MQRVIAQDPSEIADINSAFQLLKSVFTGKKAYYLETGELLSLEDMSKQSILYDTLDVNMMNTGKNVPIEKSGNIDVCLSLIEMIYSEHVK